MRGAGKTTWASTWFADAHVIDLGDARRCHQLLADPAQLARDVREAPRHLAIVVNDVQRAGPLLSELWRLTATTSRQFVLLGSSVCPLRTSGPQLATHAPSLTMFRVLVYLGDRAFRTEEGVDVVPLADWFDAVATSRVWP